jgi:subtilisin family serine protease
VTRLPATARQGGRRQTSALWLLALGALAGASLVPPLVNGPWWGANPGGGTGTPLVGEAAGAAAASRGVVHGTLFEPASDPSATKSHELLVKFEDGTAPEVVSAVLARAGVDTELTVGKIGLRVVEPERTSLEQAEAALKAAQPVEYVERDVVVHAADTTPNDALWSSQWGPSLVKAPRAWDAVTGSPSVVVAVLDTGVDFTHPDLRGAFVAGYDFVNRDADPSDDNGHGTAAAGVIAARTNNREGEAGLCWACALMPVKVLDRKGDGTSATLAAAIVWAANHGARVISMSLGSPGTSQALTDAIAYAARKGVVLVGAAGNAGTTTPNYPGAYPSVLGVAATTPSDVLYDWSNRGGWVDVTAPGCNTAPASGATYVHFCGTSSATPVVAGLAGLALSLKPQATKGEVEQAITGAAVPLAGNPVQFGRVDASEMVVALGGATRITPAVDPSTSTSQPRAAPAASSLPVPVDLPTVDGTAEVDRTLTGTIGRWTGDGPITYAFQWERCPASGSVCDAIAAATAQAYQTTSQDINATLRLRVTATNPNGTASATSAPTGAVVVPAPANTRLPEVRGETRVGRRLRARVGGWTGTPSIYLYQWRRCDSSGARCTNIGGATHDTYRLGSPDRGKRVLVVVTAANVGGSATALSVASARVRGPRGKMERAAQ